MKLKLFMAAKIFLTVAVTLSFLGHPRAEETIPKTLLFGFISDFPEEEIKQYKALTDYLALKLKSEGIAKVKPIIPASILAMGHLLHIGKIDFFIDSPVTSLAVQQLADIEFMLRQWKGGFSEYKSVIFVKSSSPIKDLIQFKGKVLAFEDHYSTTGYWIPRYELTKLGLDPFRRRGPHQEIPPNQVAYIFSYDNQDTIRWVRRGLVAGGATDNETFKTNNRGETDLRILYESILLPRHLVSYRIGLPEPLVQKVKKILLNMDKSPEGRKALREFENTTRFDEIPGGPKALENSLAFIKAFIRQSLGLQ